MSQILSIELDVLHWYLVRRSAPPKTSRVLPEHWTTPIFGAAWRRAQSLSEPDLFGLGLSASEVEKILGHEGPPTERSLRESERRLVEHWARTVVADAAAKVAERISRDPEVPVDEIAQHLRESIAVAEAGQLSTSTPAKRIRHELVERKIVEWKDGGRPRSVPIGIPEIQRDLGGFLRGKFSLWIAPTSGHKTTIARTLATFAGQHGFDSVYYTLEDSPHDIEARSIVAESQTVTTRMIHGDRFPPEEHQLADIIDAVDKAPEHLRYGRGGRLTLQQLCSQIRNEACSGLSAVFIDHLHRLRQSGRDGFDFWCNVGDSLADLALELDITIVAMAQIDKVSQGEATRGERLPTMSSVRYGGALTDPARTVFLIHRLDSRIPNDEPEVEKFSDRDAYSRALAIWQAKQRGQRVIKIVCEKNTNGPLGDWAFELDPAHDRIGRAL